MFNKYDIEKRTLYYWGKRYSAQLQEGQTYKLLKKCVTINILNYSFLPNEYYHNTFHLREDRTGIELTDDIEVHFIELSKLDQTAVPVQGGLINWLLFLTGTDKTNWEVLEMNEPTLKKAMTSLEYLSQDREARLRYEERQKFLHDEASAIEFALEKGIQEGERRKTLNIAKGLLQAGVKIEIIAETTGLTTAEIASLK